ncbi:hypothetical protein JSQ81_02685 [Sporosarcina sp. Marseille-Q4063]|uniref:hypothetical protein n=1 Tax=Sporosarcina sp. Marseille-Q4063 TaxID=2810514 RepID=UPI001BAF7BD5|nr:hypothetical protein [Sporosarcina sp. Marseille-Q4063]QUW22512.1 hypothetical protein JSQ81_02685 [Sporosarcina sp. Marseille-Q4063]
MWKQGNEKGYTLLIVLFVITFIMIISASFVTASVSNAKQEKVIDTNNMAVVAAEMGIDYYLNKMEIEEVKATKSTLTTIIEPYLIAYNSCQKNKSLPICTSIKTIDDIKADALKHYKDKLEGSINSFATEGSTPLDSTHTLPSYNLSNPKLSIETFENMKDKIIINFKVIGSSISQPERELSTVLEFNIPEFITTSPLEDNPGTENITAPEDVFNYFQSRDDYKKVTSPCTVNGHCDPGKFYSSGNVDSDNPNNQGGLIWVHKGFLDAKNNMNKMNFTLIAQTIKVVNNLKMEVAGRVILLGIKDGNGMGIGELTIGKDIEVSPGGMFCINIDGFPKDKVEKLTFDKKTADNRVVFYSGAVKPNWPSNAKDSQKRTGSLSAFVNECAGSTVIEGASYEANPETPNFEVDVKY